MNGNAKMHPIANVFLFFLSILKLQNIILALLHSGQALSNDM